LIKNEELFSVSFNFTPKPHKATDEEARVLGTAVHRSIICGLLGGGGGEV